MSTATNPPKTSRKDAPDPPTIENCQIQIEILDGLLEDAETWNEQKDDLKAIYRRLIVPSKLIIHGYAAHGKPAFQQKNGRVNAWLKDWATQRNGLDLGLFTKPPFGKTIDVAGAGVSGQAVMGGAGVGTSGGRGDGAAPGKGIGGQGVAGGSGVGTSGGRGKEVRLDLRLFTKPPIGKTIDVAGAGVGAKAVAGGSGVGTSGGRGDGGASGKGVGEQGVAGGSGVGTSGGRGDGGASGKGVGERGVAGGSGVGTSGGRGDGGASGKGVGERGVGGGSGVGNTVRGDRGSGGGASGKGVEALNPDTPKVTAVDKAGAAGKGVEGLKPDGPTALDKALMMWTAAAQAHVDKGKAKAMAKVVAPSSESHEDMDVNSEEDGAADRASGGTHKDEKGKGRELPIRTQDRDIEDEGEAEGEDQEQPVDVGYEDDSEEEGDGEEGEGEEGEGKEGEGKEGKEGEGEGEEGEGEEGEEGEGEGEEGEQEEDGGADDDGAKSTKVKSGGNAKSGKGKGSSSGAGKGEAGGGVVARSPKVKSRTSRKRKTPKGTDESSGPDTEETEAKKRRWDPEFLATFAPHKVPCEGCVQYERRCSIKPDEPGRKPSKACYECSENKKKCSFLPQQTRSRRGRKKKEQAETSVGGASPGPGSEGVVQATAAQAPEKEPKVVTKAQGGRGRRKVLSPQYVKDESDDEVKMDVDGPAVAGSSNLQPSFPSRSASGTARSASGKSSVLETITAAATRPNRSGLERASGKARDKGRIRESSSVSRVTPGYEGELSSKTTGAALSRLSQDYRMLENDVRDIEGQLKGIRRDSMTTDADIAARVERLENAQEARTASSDQANRELSMRVDHLNGQVLQGVELARRLGDVEKNIGEMRVNGAVISSIEGRLNSFDGRANAGDARVADMERRIGEMSGARRDDEILAKLGSLERMAEAATISAAEYRRELYASVEGILRTQEERMKAEIERVTQAFTHSIRADIAAFSNETNQHYQQLQARLLNTIDEVGRLRDVIPIGVSSVAGASRGGSQRSMQLGDQSGWAGADGNQPNLAFSHNTRTVPIHSSDVFINNSGIALGQHSHSVSSRVARPTYPNQASVSLPQAGDWSADNSALSSLPTSDRLSPRHEWSTDNSTLTSISAGSGSGAPSSHERQGHSGTGFTLPPPNPNWRQGD
ncbi:hypothetical protein DFP72DRAFT_1060501 [Ephemerocybe angulata]|uniref:Uncharacterized protein n=1 Tax=Ephemerocybe angulata TaxID=980116 RepID=A0A8H6ID32_9AGAR|nr:hypothetical protein DFP72DRAFT_1060501 [Tulosesus angulatus]